ncbi:hypothetical protein GVN18_34090 [Pseudomonas sp. ODNR1LW]|nr:hypothetical protein [Pseudomonas sp. ODNR1LW]
MTEAITSLIEKLEAADAGSRELDRLIGEATDSPMGMSGDVVGLGYDKYSTSIDAAMALADRVLGQRGPININICLAGSAQVVIEGIGPCNPVMAQVVARNPALALCAATLSAKAKGASK